MLLSRYDKTGYGGDTAMRSPESVMEWGRAVARALKIALRSSI